MRTQSSGPMKVPAKFPISRWKPLWGSVSLKGMPELSITFLPAGDAALDFADVVVAEARSLSAVSAGLCLPTILSADDFAHGVIGVGEDVIVGEFCFRGSVLEAAGEIVGGVGGDVGAVEVERVTL